MTSDELLELETTAMQSIDGNLRGPALKAVARIRELEGEKETLIGELARALRTIKPFADCVFNDNGDMSVQGSGDYGDFVNAYWSERSIKATLTTIRAAQPDAKPKQGE